MLTYLSRLILSLSLVLIGTPAFAQQAMDLTAQSARIYRSSNGVNLTLPSQASPVAVVAGFLRSQGHSAETIQSLVTVAQGQAPQGGLLHQRLEQRVGGLAVYGTYVKATLNSRGELMHLIENLVTANRSNLAPASISSRDALQSALSALYPNVSANVSETSRSGNTTHYAVTESNFYKLNTTRIAIPMETGVLHEGFLVETWTQRDNLLHHTLIDRDGAVLGIELRTNNDSYNIFPGHPGNSTQTVRSGPGTGNSQSPSGWLSGNQTTINIGGNNVRAYLDTDNNNAPDSGGATVTDGHFLTAADLNIDPSTATNKAVAVQNLFYFNNVIHDKLYTHGFNETAGNFQTNNFGNGGAGNDPVNAEAQDGGGTDNANFSTPADGSSPRMQMYLWTQTSPRRDGDLDSDIIWHEYGHGLTWRMIGNMSGPMSGAIGEGMSDVLAILINENDVVGEYSYNNPLGIRSARYTNYPRTYGDFTGSSVHYDGEIYAATIWRLWENFQAIANSDKNKLFDYLVDGMNYTPAGPAMENMRDGILQMASGTSHYCLIWDAFADFGIGVGATATVKGGGPFGGGKVTVTESFAVPAACSGGTNNQAPVVSISTPVANGGTSNATAGSPVSFSASANDAENGNVSASLLWTSNRDGQIGTGPSFSTSDLTVGTHTITATATDSDGATGHASITVIVSSTSAGIELTATLSTKGALRALLSWSGATSASVDIFRNTTRIATTTNSGSYSDNLNKLPAGTYTYKICEASTNRCSNEASVPLRVR